MSSVIYLLIGFMAGSLFVTFTSPKSDKKEEME
jgi:uncharacterized membrane protein YuzA (DUF378 family)